MYFLFLKITNLIYKNQIYSINSLYVNFKKYYFRFFFLMRLSEDMSFYYKKTHEVK